MSVSSNKKKCMGLAFLCTLGGAAIAAGSIFYFNNDKLKFADKYMVLEECETFLKDEDYNLANTTDALNGIISGFMKANGDAYGYYTYMSEEDKYLQLVNRSTSLRSTGYQVDNDGNGYLKIVYVESNTEAEKQGLKTNDIIKEINAVDVKETGITKIAEKLMGKDGTTVELKIERDGEILDLELKRKNDISSSSISGKMLDDTAYIKISAFTTLTDTDFSSATKEIDLNGGKLIIDLRQNGGGTIDSVISTAGHFIDNGTVVEHHNTGEEDELRVIPMEEKFNGNIVILTDNETASGAEILTALLKQYDGDNVQIVGTNTYGKGVFQLEHTLSNGGILHYTAGYYTVGDWECYDGVGIAPDIEVEMDSSLIGTDDDIQLQKAIELLS